MMIYRLCCLLLLCWTPVAAVGADEDRSVRVAVFDDTGVGRSLQDLLHTLRQIDGVYITRVNAEEIRNGILDEFDIVIHPGGSGSRQANTLGSDGRENVRDFIRAGNGFIGICAGAYLASADYPWSLHVLDARVLDRKHWNRGTGTVQIKLSESGKSVLDRQQDSVSIYYGQGPLLAPAGKADIADFETLATYQSEIAKKGAPTGVMIGTTAIARGKFGDGRVFCFSPHPEKTEGLETFIRSAIDDLHTPQQRRQPNLPAEHLTVAESTPDISQKGLPNSNYCAPCAAANLLYQFDARLLLELPLPKTPTDQKLAKTLGDDDHMETESKRGTNRYRLVNGMDRWVREHEDQKLSIDYLGLRLYDRSLVDAATRSRVARTCGVPRLRHIQQGLASGDGVIILFGSYKPSATSGRLERLGGHYVCVVGYGQNAEGDPDASAILLHDSNDGRQGLKCVFARPVNEPTELWIDDVPLARSRSLVQLENAPIRKDGRVAFLETVFTFRVQ